MNSAESSHLELSRSNQSTIVYLQSPRAIRDRCTQIFDLAQAGQLQHFDLDLSRLPQVAHYVTDVTRRAYPDLNIPVHSRWRHFETGGLQRLQTFRQRLQTLAPLDAARACIDLVVVSVLLDAGAGTVWRYRETQTGQVWARSEGLAIASFHLFCSGLFSSNPDQPLRVDAAALQRFTLEQLADGFQVSTDNPLVGLEGRLHLLQQLGDALERSPHFFGREPARPGHIVDFLKQQTIASDNQGESRPNATPPDSTLAIPAATLLTVLLEGLGSIWPGRVVIDGVNLGDVWAHPALPQTSPFDNLVPFHKLSQWLTYSLLEPLQEAGLTVVELDQLTGLPEYRNGGLFVDLGVLKPKHTAVIEQPHRPGSSVIVEWRALTVILLDRVAALMREALHLSAAELPLATVLQGGTWNAGRAIARDRRSDGSPPIQIESDGTVF